MLEDRTHAHAWMLPDYKEAQLKKQGAFRKVAESLREEGYRVHYLPGAQLIGDDSEATTDGSHPSDLGAMRYADAVTPVLADLLEASSKVPPNYAQIH